MSIIHVCFSSSAEVNISYALRKKMLEGDKVIALKDDLSLGCLGSDELISRRQVWWDNVYKESSNKYLVPSMERIYIKFWEEIKELDSNEFCLWFGKNTQEACGMLYLVNLLKDSKSTINYVNVSNILCDDKYISAVSDVPSRKLNEYYMLQKKLREDVKQRLNNQWNELLEANTLLRVLDNDNIKSVQENYYDKTILSKLDNISKEASRVAAMVMSSQDAPVCDRFILWRIRELILSRKIKSDGNIYNMMELHIKR